SGDIGPAARATSWPPGRCWTLLYQPALRWTASTHNRPTGNKLTRESSRRVVSDKKLTAKLWRSSVIRVFQHHHSVSFSLQHLPRRTPSTTHICVAVRWDQKQPRLWGSWQFG
ncbi:unnamed protein product, partial [Ectocarpus sp. 12 AP-2014]